MAKNLHDIRLQNLSKLIDNFELGSGNRAAFCRAYGFDPLQMGQYFTESDHGRKMGERKARSIETKIGLNLGWLDNDHSDMDTDFKSRISKWLKSARETAGLSGDQLGARLALEMGTERGNSKSNISHWENKRHEPNIQQIVAISKITRQKLPDEISELLNLNGKKLEPSKQVYALTWVREDELELLTRYRLASESGKALILNMAEETPREESK